MAELIARPPARGSGCTAEWPCMQNSAPQKSRSRTVRSFAGEKLPRRDEIHLSVRRNSQFEKENSQLFVFPFLAKPPDRMAFIPTTNRQRSRFWENSQLFAKNCEFGALRPKQLTAC